MKTAGSRARTPSRGVPGSTASDRCQTAVFSQTLTRLAMMASASDPRATALRASATSTAWPANRYTRNDATGAATIAAASFRLRVRAAKTASAAIAATPAPPAASRKKWFAVTTIENTTRAG